MLPVEIRKEENIAIIAPHPDDEVIGVGGLLLAYPSQCTVILMTDGRHGDSNMEPGILKSRRQEEFSTVISKLGVRSICLDYEDGTLLGREKCFENIDFGGYSKVFLPCADDNHPDHMAACLYAKNRIEEQRLLEMEIYQYEVHLPLHVASHYLDISGFIEQKKLLISLYQSQMGIHDYPNQVVSLASYRGYQNNTGGRYLEAYLKTSLSADLMKNVGLEQEKRLEKAVCLNRLLGKWVEISIRGLRIGKYLRENNVKSVAIYGWGDVGKKLYHELVQWKVRTEYVLDKNVADTGLAELEIYSPAACGAALRTVDAVIVTVLTEFNEIKELLENLGYRNIYSLNNILDKVLFAE